MSISSSVSCSNLPASVLPPLEGRLLLSWNNDALSLEWDLLHRYSLVARLLDRLLERAPTPVRVLEVGCHIHNVLPRLLNPRLVETRRCDIQPFVSDPDFFVIPAQPPWPVESESYDAVVALEVIEHIPVSQRRAFIAECLRVARHGVIFTCPHAHSQVVEAEGIAAAAFQQRHGRAHDFLLEHDQMGLPAEDEIQNILRDLDCPHTVLETAPLDAWLALLVLWENLKERQDPLQIQQRLNALRLKATAASSFLPYRKIYVCARTFDASAALEPLPGLTPSSTTPSETPIAAAALQFLAAQMCDALADQHTTHVAAVAALRDELLKQQANAQVRLSELLDDHRADLCALQDQLADVETARSDFRQQALIFQSFLQSLTGSRLWKLLQPVRSLRHLARPRGFDAGALIPWQQLERDSEKGQGHWIATGSDPYFIVPCTLPAGSFRVRLKITSDVPGQLAFFADDSSGRGGKRLLDEAWVCDTLDTELVLRLPQPSLALRFDPIDAPGRFHLEAFEVTPISPVSTWLGSGPDASRVTVVNGLSNANANTGAAPLEPTEHAETCDSIGAPGDRRLNIVYVLRTAGLCGGVKVVFEHVSRLRERGHNARIFCLEGKTDWFPRDVGLRVFRDVAALKRALTQFRGIKVATWYETAPWVADCLRSGDRGYYLVQDIEESYCGSTEDAAVVLGTYSLGLKPITEGVWVRDRLKERFGLDSVFVSIGLDHALFHPLPATRDPHLLLSQARTWSGGGAAGRRLKGWDTARDVVLRCRQLNSRASVMTFSMEERPPFPAEIPHVHHRLPSDQQLARLYNRAGLYLMTSTHEGFGLPAAEAMACGCPVVATRAHGNEEFCIDGVTALVAAPGDVEQLAQRCLRLQTDPAFARELGENGRQFILNYTWDRVVDRLEQEFLQVPGPEIVIAAPSAAPTAAVSVVADGEYPDLQLNESASVDWTVVIPTVNDAILVAQCVSTCRRYAGEDASLEFIVVDDGTRDPAVREELRRLSHELDFRLLFNRQNLGFSATVNHGMSQARGRYVLLCNNDVTFFQPWREDLDAFLEDPLLGIVGARLLYPNGTIQHAGMSKVPNQLRWLHSYGLQSGDHPSALQSRYVWCVTGALFAIRRETLQRLGGFSTAYSTAYEDVDYCLRAWSHGIHVGYCGSVAAYHLEGGTRGATPEQKSARPLLWAERERAGGLYFARKWAALRQVESYEQLLPGGRRTPAIVGAGAEVETELVAQ